MKLITKALIKKTPKLRTFAESELSELRFTIRLFAPWGSWTWYVAEADFETGEAFGLVCGFEKELGYFNLNELAAIRGSFGLGIERDIFFSGCDYDEAIRTE